MHARYVLIHKRPGWPPVVFQFPNWQEWISFCLHAHPIARTYVNVYCVHA